MILQLVYKEILYRRLNFVLGTLAVTMAVALFVSFFTTSEASKNETIRLTRDMGFNLRIIPESTDMEKFWNAGFSDQTMPQEYIQRFTLYKDFSFAHLTATLRKKITWRGREVVLTGLGSEIEPSVRKKSPMSLTIKPGTIYVGFEIARVLNLKERDHVAILGKTFIIARILSESGSDDDITIYAWLQDVQNVLNIPGRINEIQALNCLCLTSFEQDPQNTLREQLAQVLPETRVIMNRTIALARERQRLMLEKYFAFIMPFIVLACAIWIGAIVMINIKERQQEIGLLRALGYSTGQISLLFLTKAISLGILGAVCGFIIGTAVSLIYGPEIFRITADTIKPGYHLLAWSLIAAPIFAAISASLPIMIAVTQDPALTLRRE